MTISSFRSAVCMCLVGATLTLPSAAQSIDPAPVSVAERLQVLYPGTRFGAVNPTPWRGVFEVTMGSNLAYVDETGQFFLFGHLYDMKAQRDLTVERQDLLTRIDFGSLPLNDALKEVRGTGARTFAIFSDPDCPYCRRLESEMKGLTNVTIYTFLMPIASLHPEARAKAIAVWCAANRIEAWHALMWSEKPPSPSRSTSGCEHPVDRNVTLGERLGISGTPTLIAADGRVLAGAASAAQIEAWLARASASGSESGKDAPR